MDQGCISIHHLKWNTIEGKLIAIRWAHIKAGFPTPLENAPFLVKYALKTLKRLQGARGGAARAGNPLDAADNPRGSTWPMMGGIPARYL